MRMFLRLLLMMLVLATPTRAWALQSDELLLVVNKNIPASRELAEFYANARQVPQGRIVELSLGTNLEMLGLEQFERDVVPPIRQFLRERKLEEQVKCLVTFYGVPMRVAARAADPQDTQEVTEIQQELRTVLPQVLQQVRRLESIAQSLDSGFSPALASSGEGLAQRAQAAMAATMAKLPADPQRRSPVVAEMIQIASKLEGPGVVLRFGGDDPVILQAQNELASQQQQILAQVAQINAQAERRNEREARRQVRKMIGSAGLLMQARALQGQVGFLEAADSDAALDSELAMLWVGPYPRGKWLENPLHYRMAGRSGANVLMVMRLDAPEPQMVRKMILDTLRAEKDGLKGKVALDSRGMKPPEPMAPFDEQFRLLAGLIVARSRLPLVANDAPEVFGPHSVQDVALYCGWYSVQKYVPSFTFVPGAVGYHVASFELSGLHTPQSPVWGPNLIKDGVVATVGPVWEPYLSAFPLPNEFFPLLLTGKLTLAEVYWKTTTTVSWRMAAIGDPLYRPYATNPALKAQDLPAALRSALAAIQ